ncbi:hypothetical protein RU01_06700 [Rhodococcus sp. MEB064]|nr:hypothetical protein RU01_06700 [Rhodococcus sp. MEB064]
MGWNPFDRRSADQRTLDDALVGLDKPKWLGNSYPSPPKLVSDALLAWRSTSPPASATDDPAVKRLNRVRHTINRDRGAAPTHAADVKELIALKSTERGTAVYAVVVLASSVQELDAWTAGEVEHRIVRIDLTAEVQSVAASASKLDAAFSRLGPAPHGHLAHDKEVQAIYEARRAALLDRQQALCSRLVAMRRYLEGLMEIQRELEKIRWIERHGSPDISELVAREGDELAFHSLTAARDMFAANTDRIGHQLLEAAEKLSRDR